MADGGTSFTLCEWCKKPLESGSLYDLCDDCEAERELEEVLDGMETAE